MPNYLLPVILLLIDISYGQKGRIYWGGIILVFCLGIFDPLHWLLPISTTIIVTLPIELIRNPIEPWKLYFFGFISLAVASVAELFGNTQSELYYSWFYMITFGGLFSTYINFVNSHRISLFNQRIRNLIMAFLRVCLVVGGIITIPYMLKGTAQEVHNSYRLYLDYFPDHGARLFVLHTGVYLLLFYLVCLFFVFRHKISKMSIFFAIAIIFLIQQVTPIITDKTTNFRNQLLVFRVSPDKVNGFWGDVYVIGRNFRDEPFRGQILISGKEQRIMKWTDRYVLFRTDPYQTTSGQLIVVDAHGNKSEGVNFTYNED